MASAAADICQLDYDYDLRRQPRQAHYALNRHVVNSIELVAAV